MKKALLILLLTAAFAPVSYGQWICAQNNITLDLADTVMSGYVGWHRAITIDTVNYHHNIWQVGKPHKATFASVHPDTISIITDTLYPYAPNDTSVFTLSFPGSSIGGCWIGWLQFYYQLDIDSTSIAKIEFSPDSGTTWVNILDSTVTGIITYDTTLFTIPVWHSWQVNINAFGSPPYNYIGNDSLKFKFTFISGNDTTGKDGWMLSGLSVSYLFESTPTLQSSTTLTLYPNPATTQLTIESPTPINDLSITNPFGQTVYLQTAPASCKSTQIDISTLPSGMYFVKINGEVRKFLKL